MNLNYVGSGHYCYANSTSMVLQSFDYEYHSSYLESLMMIGFSAFWTKGENSVPFFSSPMLDPEEAISFALDNLGLRYGRYFDSNCEGNHRKKALRKLHDLLTGGPVIVGPLDMGYLISNPNHQDLNGVDHYVAVYDIDEYNIYFHDPAGFPFVHLPVEIFMESCFAEKIVYKSGSYSMWGKFNRVRATDDIQIKSNVITRLKNAIAGEDNLQNSLITGANAFNYMKKVMQQGNLPIHVENNLRFFSFQLAARRCSDYYHFFKDYDQELANIFLNKAKGFGATQTYLQANKLEKVIAKLKLLTDLEKTFHDYVLSL